MSMYDIIEFTYNCPHCDYVLTQFQSKDASRLMLTLEPSDVSNFYTVCPKCKAFIEFNAIEKPIYSKFSLIVSKNGETTWNKHVTIIGGEVVE